MKGGKSMAPLKQEHTKNAENQWKRIYMIGGVTALIVTLATLFDIIIGTILGGDLSAVPKSAIERFAQFQDNWLLGLYYLDGLNMATTILLIPTYFALCAAHRKVNIGYTLLAAITYFIGAAVFITNNAALSMLELSGRYFTTTSEIEKSLIAAAGEAMISRGVHGSFGAFPGFFLTSIGSIVMSIGMLKGKVFSKVNAYIGILGTTLLLIYIILVTFVPSIKSVAVIVAAPGGLLALGWMIMFTIKLFRLGRKK